MVKHIVMFNFKEENKELNLLKAKEMLEALFQTVETLKKMEVGINFSEEERAMDLSLYSEFDDAEGLAEYAVHPDHLKVVEFIKAVASASKVSDYIV
jgi:hypothetical protein